MGPFTDKITHESSDRQQNITLCFRMFEKLKCPVSFLLVHPSILSFCSKFGVGITHFSTFSFREAHALCAWRNYWSIDCVDAVKEERFWPFCSCLSRKRGASRAETQLFKYFMSDLWSWLNSFRGRFAPECSFQTMFSLIWGSLASARQRYKGIVLFFWRANRAPIKENTVGKGYSDAKRPWNEFKQRSAIKYFSETNVATRCISLCLKRAKTD